MRLQFSKEHILLCALTISTQFFTPQQVLAAEIEPKIKGTLTICKGGNAQLSATVKEGNDYASFQWQISTDNVHFTDIEGAKSSEYVSQELNSTTYFRVKVQGGETGIEEISDITPVNVVPRPSLAVKAVDAELISNTRLEATLEGGIDCKIQWQISNDAGRTWQNIDNAVGNTFVPSKFSPNVNYRAKAICSGVGCCN